MSDEIPEVDYPFVDVRSMAREWRLHLQNHRETARRGNGIGILERDAPFVDAGSIFPEPGLRPQSNGTRRPRRRAPRPSGTAATALWMLTSFTGLALWFLFHALVLTPLQQHGSQARLYAQFREQLANATAPLGGSISPGSPVALLDAGVEGLRDLVVVEGTTSEQLTLGPGHLSNTSLPGQAGVSVIFGRSVTYGAPFRTIAGLRAGHEITATTGQGVFTYRVDRPRRPGDPLPPVLPANGSRLTLVTSAASGWRSGWAPDHAIYLDATLTGGRRDGAPIPKPWVQPAPAGRPATATKNALPMRGDASALTLFALVFWLQALLLVSGGLLWAWTRWGRWQAWLAGLPVALAVLWGASGAAARLLPNLI